jgi:hypothetical protein
MAQFKRAVAQRAAELDYAAIRLKTKIMQFQNQQRLPFEYVNPRVQQWTSHY